MPAEQRGHRFAARVEYDRAHLPDVYPRRTHRQRERGMGRIAERSTDRDAERRGVLAKAIDEVAAGFHRGVGTNAERHVFHAHDGKGCEVRGTLRALAHDVVGERRHRIDRHVVRVTRVRIEIRHGNGAAATGLVDDVHGYIDELSFLDDALNRPSHAVLRPTGARADDDLDRLRGFPRLRMKRPGCEHCQRPRACRHERPA
jgi:hypothetical protein